MKVRILKIFLVLCVISLLNSCVLTTGLWIPDEVNEKVSYLMVSQDGKFVTIVGKENDYIFIDKDRKILELLKLYGAGSYSTNIDSITTKGGIATANIKFLLDRKYLTQAENFYTEGVVEVNLTGKQYEAGSVLNYCKSNSYIDTKFASETELITLTKHSTFIQNVGKIFLMPFYIVADIIISPYVIGDMIL